MIHDKQNGDLNPAEIQKVKESDSSVELVLKIDEAILFDNP